MDGVANKLLDGIRLPVAVNYRMLALARESRGLNQTDLSDKARQADTDGVARGLSQATISKVENGTQSATPEVVETYSEVLRYTPRFFSQQLETRNLPVTFRRKSRLSARAMHHVEAMLNVQRGHVLTMLQSVDIPENRIPHVDLGERGSYSVQDVARDLRAQWHVPRGPIANVTTLLESFGAIVIKFDFKTSPITGVSGVTFYDPHDGEPPLIFVNSAMTSEQARFVLAHELAHAILHQHLPLPPVEAEVEARAFAYEFLLPSSDIRGYLTRVKLETVLELKAHWRVPGAAIVQRAATLGRVTDRQKQYLMGQMGHLGGRDPRLTPWEEPTLLSEMVHFHTDRLEYTDDDMANTLCLLDVSEFREIYRPTKGGILRLVR